jgi:hypothetical protein
MRVVGSAVLIFCLTTPIVCGQTKPPWEWTEDERIAARTNPALAVIRLESAAGAYRIKSGSPLHDVIDGKRDAALFLPIELFETMVRHGFPDDGWREAFAREITAAGLPDDFWPQLERLADRYIADRREDRERRQLPDAASHEAVLCRDRATALAAARAAFGPALDRFLYMSVAPSRKDFVQEISDVSRLKAMAQGCQ